jgi:hypothetical protein
MHISRPILLVPVLAVALTAPASAATLTGTVVHQNHHAHSFVIATSKGRLTAIHATHSPKVGRLVRVDARKLRNGTYAVSKVRAVGKRTKVRLRGRVTYVHRARKQFTLSARGASILIRKRTSGARAAADVLPPVGDNVIVEAEIDDQGNILATTVTDQGAGTGSMDIEGNILAIDTAARTLSISADDDNASGGALKVSVPAAIDLSKFQVGQEVQLLVTAQPDGTFVLSSLSGDDNEQEADGPAEVDDNGAGGGD